MKCAIIKDLLPSYIDGLTSSESNLEIETHIENCTECKDIFEQMKAEMNAEIKTEEIDLNKEKIKPFKKLNKRVFKAVLITLAACIALVGAYMYFFGVGWKVNSEDMNIEYSFQDDSIVFEFELTNGRVLNAWTNKHAFNNQTIKFTECFPSILDDRGEQPNRFSYGIGYLKGENGEIREFDEDDYVILYFQDKTETFYLKELVEELDKKE
jgi:hypothetical protein